MSLDKRVIKLLMSIMLMVTFALPVMASTDKVKISENTDFFGNLGMYIINNNSPQAIWSVITDQNGFRAICKVLERIEL